MLCDVRNAEVCTLFCDFVAQCFNLSAIVFSSKSVKADAMLFHMDQFVHEANFKFFDHVIGRHYVAHRQKIPVVTSCRNV